MFLAGAAVFSAVYGLAPLYYSNQNQYFLHGLAQAGVGCLREDWLANTRDPTPVFTALVAFTVKYLHPWLFYLYYALLLGAYVAGMLGLFAFVVSRAVAIRRWPAFLALFVAIHSALARWCSYRCFGQDYPWFLQAGVAGQYVLGAYLQPSAFGVLLIVAVDLFVHGRLGLAGSCVGLAAIVHPSYLLAGGLLTLGFIAALVAERHFRQALGLGVFSLALVTPIIVHVVVVFGPTSAETFVQAQEVLVNLRIPHHSRPDRWMDAVAVLQLGWMLLALVLVRKTRLFLVLCVPFGLGVLLTLVLLLTGSPTLALLFPWRVSAVLVPIATTIVLSKLSAAPIPGLESTTVRLAAGAVVAVCVSAGCWIRATGIAFRSGDEELGVMNFVRRTVQSGDVYFLPVTVPDLAKTTRGSLSSDFKPLPDKRQDARIIPVDLQRFRLYTGAPIYVDFKAIPYKDSEVVEWRDRIHRTQIVPKLLGTSCFSRAVAFAYLRELGVTHLIVPADARQAGDGPDMIYHDEYYRIYRIDQVRHGD